MQVPYLHDCYWIILKSQNKMYLLFYIDNYTAWFIIFTDSSFSRLSHLNQNIQIGKLPSTIIETSTRSELLVTPGTFPKIVFEVTNNLDRATYLMFACQDEKSLLRNLYPRRYVLDKIRNHILKVLYCYT